MRREPPGNVWRTATAIDVPDDLNQRYGGPLDLLVRRVQPHLWDCNGGIWEPPGGDDALHRLSLALLGVCLSASARKPACRATNHSTQNRAGFRQSSDAN
jgi:hypothetical protein